jgi:signal transduction histidine kinase
MSSATGTCGQLHGRLVTVVVEAVGEHGSLLSAADHPVSLAFRAPDVVNGGSLRIIRPDGDMRWIYMDAMPVLTPDDTLAQVVVSFADVTEAKVAEQQRLELDRQHAARAQAEEAVRARDEFLSIAAHGLKTPIASLRLAAQLLMQSVQQPDPASSAERLEKLAGMIIQQSTKISRIVEQLLDISRLDAGKLGLDRAPADVADLVESVVATARARSDKHTIVIRAPHTPVIAAVDALRIEQVLWNLVDNAIKYSPFGGEIEPSVRERTPERVQVDVRDRGVGIPPEQLRRVFERFYQVGHAGHVRNVAGLGLGLFISQQIVELHGGTISAESPVDGGTRVIVTLPTRLHPADVAKTDDTEA